MTALNHPVPSQKVKGRDLRFDLLKTLGILCIILAHCQPPEIIFQIRNFDVPLMVIVSGSLFYLSFKEKKDSFFSYLKKRIPRLIAPVWCFLVFFFVAVYLLSQLTDIPSPYNWNAVWGSFLLRGGTRYVYIIRVFVLMALVAPLVLKLYRAIGNSRRFLLTLIGIYASYEILNQALKSIRLWPAPLSIAVKEYLMLCLPYGCLVGLGIVLVQANRKLLIGFAIACLSAFLAQAGVLFHLTGQFVQTQTFKYPPTLYYLSYGVAISLLTYLLVDWIGEKPGLFPPAFKPVLPWIEFISSASLWIYLWHIFWLFAWQFVVQHQFSVGTHFAVMFLMITGLSIATTYGQRKGVTHLIQSTKFGQRYATTLTVLFLR